jgi:hypothetical protein
MSSNSITSVLGLLRLIKAHHSESIEALLRGRFSVGPEKSSYYKVVSYLLEQIEIAESEIAAIEVFDDEVKNGLLQATSVMKVVLQPSQLNSSLSQRFPTIDATVSQFAMLANVVSGMPPLPPPDEVDELVRDLDAFIERVTKSDLPLEVQSLVIKHVGVLQILLRTVQIVGIDSAYAAYAELVVRLRREEGRRPPEVAKSLGGFWSEVEKWFGRLASIDKAMSAGENMIGHVQGIQKLLSGGS